MATYIQNGGTIDYTATLKVAAGDVVDLTSRIGVAAGDIPAGTVGSLTVEGIFEIAKTDNLAIAVGDTVYFNTTTKKITKTNSDVSAGWAVAAASASDTTVRVKIG